MRFYIEAIITIGLGAILGMILIYLEMTYPRTAYYENMVLIMLFILAFSFEILPEIMPQKMWKSLANLLRKKEKDSS